MIYIIVFCGRKADMHDFWGGESIPDPQEGEEGNVDNGSTGSCR